MVDDVIAMSQSCSRCNTAVANTCVEIRHPLQFLEMLREIGWSIHETHPASHPTLCPKCAGN